MSKRKHHNGHSHPELSADDKLALLERSPTAKEYKATTSKPPAKASVGGYMRCYESHPALPLSEGIVVYGGSCMYPIVEDADIYIGHDHSMKKSIKTYPWEEGESVQFLIPDMGIPESKEQFAKMLDWLVVQLTAKKKVHVGCIGGHGRTGMTLSGLAFLMRNEKDAISYVREHYCQKAVESQAQINFLHDLYGITKANPAKGHYSMGSPTPTKAATGPVTYSSGVTSNTRAQYKQETFDMFGQSQVIHPAKSDICIWGANVQLVKSK